MSFLWKGKLKICLLVYPWKFGIAKIVDFQLALDYFFLKIPKIQN